jgi:hypothetical protein
LPLLPLGPEAIAELLDDLLGRDPSRAELHELLRDRTGGNPFFVEEAVQALIEAGSLEGSRGACRVVRPIARKPTGSEALGRLESFAGVSERVGGLRRIDSKKRLPMTEASWSTPRAFAGSRSMRAARSARTVGGTPSA